MKSISVLRVIIGFNLAQAVARSAFGIIGLISGLQQFLNVTINSTNSAIMEIGFLGLGITGTISLIGLATKHDWATNSILVINVATISFDIWGLTIQPTAAIGFIVPILTLGYFLVMRYQDQNRLSSDA